MVDYEHSVKQTIDGYAATMLTNYLGISSWTLVIADFLHTFPDEVRLMWPTPLSFPKVLFFALRYYYVLIHGVWSTIYGLPRGFSPEECRTTFVRIGVSSITVMIASEGILFIRVYAFSGRNKKMLVYLIFQFIAIHAPTFALLGKFLSTVKFVQLPVDNVVCMPAEAQSILLSAVFVLLLGSILIIMFIMVYLALRKHRDLNSTLLTIFYRDGVFYFVILSILAIGNIVVNIRAPDNGLKFLLVQTEVDAHAILSTRMLLHLRSWADRERRSATEFEGQGYAGGGGTVADAFDYSTAHGDGTRAAGGRRWRELSIIKFGKNPRVPMESTYEASTVKSWNPPSAWG